jgi:hypothetical protein
VASVFLRCFVQPYEYRSGVIAVVAAVCHISVCVLMKSSGQSKSL